MSSYVRPNLDLCWYFQESATELGLSGAPLEPSSRGDPQRWPSHRACAAVERQRRIRARLAQLSLRHQRVLETCYELRRVPVQYHRYGAAARLVQGAALVEQALATVRAAHAAYDALVPPQKPRRARRQQRFNSWLLALDAIPPSPAG